MTPDVYQPTSRHGVRWHWLGRVTINGNLLPNTTGVHVGPPPIKSANSVFTDRGPSALGGASCRRDWAPGMTSMRPRQTGRKLRLVPRSFCYERTAFPFLESSCYVANPRTNSWAPRFLRSLPPQTSVCGKKHAGNPDLTTDICLSLLEFPSHRFAPRRNQTEATMGDKAQSVSPRAASPANSPPRAAQAISPPFANEESAPLDVDEVRSTGMFVQGAIGFA